ncbi:MAG TPA: tetratricopeptide repeat protein, partial [Blastocatellia bacterium]|nr:tetratricopeptide repeat protein [Blastocatellia bacterium]
MIQGTIFFDNGRRADRRIKVRLRGLNNDSFTMSDDSGAFAFRRLAGGSYTVTVDAGNEFEVASETVDIIEPMRRRNDPGQTLTVQITLHARAAASRPVGTVDANGGIPDQALQLYKVALDFVQAGEHKKAIEQLNEAVKLYPTFWQALNELGLVYMRQKQFDKAEPPLRKATELAPEAFLPQLNFGILMNQKKDYVTAATALQRAVQKEATSGVAHFHFGKALVNLGAYPRAEKELLQALNIGGEFTVEAHRYLGAAYIEMNNKPRAIEQLEQYLSLAPKAKDAEQIRQIVNQLRSKK